MTSQYCVTTLTWAFYTVIQYQETIGVARMFDGGGGPNHKSYAMTSSKTFERRTFLWGKVIVEWKSRSSGLVWHKTRILLTRNGLNQKLKIENA